jgi:NitT/TauT family transport system substrate-binding protein
MPVLAGRRGPRAVAALAVLALVAGACGGDDDTIAAPAEAPASAGPRLPETIAEGCGDQAATDPANLSVSRVVARCGAGAPAAAPLPAPATVRVAVPARLGPELAPLLLAEATGEFAAENLTVERVTLGPAEAVDALVAGEVDLVAGLVTGPYFDALHDGAGVRVVLGGVLATAPNDLTVGQTGLWVRDDALDEGQLRGLRLQPVVVPDGVRSGATYPLRLLFGQTEISLNDVAVTDGGGGEAAQALLDGELAAAWLDGGSWLPVAGNEGFHLAATLPASESVDGTIAGERLLGPDRAVGTAYVRAVVRTINTYLTGDYRGRDEVIGPLAERIGVDADALRQLPPLLFDWEVREGTLGRMEEGLRGLGGVTYDVPLDPARLVDRTLVADAVGVAPASASA